MVQSSDTVVSFNLLRLRCRFSYHSDCNILLLVSMAPDANDKNLFKWHEDKKKGERESENKNKVGILCKRARRRRIDAVVTSQHGIVRMASSSSPDAYIVLIKVDICLFDGERISVLFFFCCCCWASSLDCRRGN